ncbi:response regulator transcription factor [Oxynema aestuarii]|uniref:Response regulator transcription factor n=1 Tax=Oxynema aestuarii AP17 TaxID=2064643 RepID=A0A6H1TV72_9CYAN|nr:response regulator transcription factor [Oxynema aestuarii]QIZ70492.1 response regulator transcription factor [Oxynema aestuarii AP17]
MRILVVEDDIPLAETLAEVLSDERYIVDIARDGEAAWQQVTQVNYDLIILDIMLPKLDGVSLCKRMRSNGYFQPILLLTALDTSRDKVKGLDAGADDYLVKPVDLSELFARLRALLRRSQDAAPPILTWGDLRLDPTTYEVTYGDRPLQLTPKEYSLLELFVRNGRRVLSRGEILEYLWSLEEPPSEETVKAHIKSLRRKFREIGAPDDPIETVHGFGYRLRTCE